jgi:acyl dehydratase
MPVPSDAVGQQTEPITHVVDERWLMAYAAGLGETKPVYLDTTAPGGISAHPLFPVCVEWPVVLAVGALDVLSDVTTPEEKRRGIHATHDLTMLRPIVPGDVLTTVATVIGVEKRPPGALLTMDMVSTDVHGREVFRTRQGSLYLATDVIGPDRAAPDDEPLPPIEGDPVVTVDIPIDAGAAHTYTECARIWNPIHTDLAVALAADLPGLILHGTATLAHGVSVGVHHLAGGDPNAIVRVRGRFGAMVPMPATLTVSVYANGRFEVRTPDGGQAVKNGHLTVS